MNSKTTENCPGLEVEMTYEACQAGLPCLDIIALLIGVVIAGDDILMRGEIKCALVERPGQGKDSFSIFKAHEDIAKCTRALQTWMGVHVSLD